MLLHYMRQILSVSGKSITLRNLAELMNSVMKSCPDCHSANKAQATDSVCTDEMMTFQQHSVDIFNKLAALLVIISTIHVR